MLSEVIAVPANTGAEAEPAEVASVAFQFTVESEEQFLNALTPAVLRGAGRFTWVNVPPSNALSPISARLLSSLIVRVASAVLFLNA